MSKLIALIKNAYFNNPIFCKAISVKVNKAIVSSAYFRLNLHS